MPRRSFFGTVGGAGSARVRRFGDRSGRTTLGTHERAGQQAARRMRVGVSVNPPGPGMGPASPGGTVMSKALSISELEGQHAELLPARTLMSKVSGGAGGKGGNGGNGGIGVNLLNINLGGDQS